MRAKFINKFLNVKGEVSQCLFYKGRIFSLEMLQYLSNLNRWYHVIRPYLFSAN